MPRAVIATSCRRSPGKTVQTNNCIENSVEMTDSADPTTDDYDIAIVGGGPAGSAAGVFLARADFDVLLVDHGQSVLKRCAFLENYLGFPTGISPAAFRELMIAHTETAGCERIEAAVESIAQAPDEEQFRLHTTEKTHGTRYVLVTSWAETEYLAALGVETRPDDHADGVDIVSTDETGQTNVDRVYAAGRITGTYHQALVNAGDGARVARAIVEREHPEFYNDWVAPEGYYEYADMAIPEGVEEISHEQRRNREQQATEWLAAFFEDRRSTQ
jgi:pyruvate/2-oxoglutarate dehydrogenase complex dihydrolipoamide dehydrogenase (E3) component